MTHATQITEGKIGTPKDYIAEIYRFTEEQDLEEQEANARLIAAAPDLLEALEFIVNCVPEPGKDTILNVEGYNKACEAISRATI